MNNQFTFKTFRLLAAALLGAASLSGCADSSEEEKTLARFSSSVADFTDYIQEADGKINNLDVTKKESADELLELLDDMDAKFADFANTQMPAQYENVKDLAVQASEEMSLAVSHYHTAYESEPFHESYADAAYQCYERSYECVQLMGYLLAGEKIPENDHVKVYEESNDKNILDKWLSNDESESSENETASDELSEAIE